MKVTLAAAALVSVAVLPQVLRSRLYACATPRLLVWFGAASLFAIAACSISLLAAIVSPAPVPLADFPRAMGICIDEASRLLSNPLHHWPSIAAALLLAAAVVRVIVVAALVARDAVRAKPPGDRFPGEEEALRRHLGITPPRLRLLPFEGSVAYTTGFLRPVTVVSEGLMRALAPSERLAVVAHEHVHALCHHTVVLSITRIVARAFGFVPGIRISTELLTTGLEARADVHAAMMVGDPLVVARAMTASARLTSVPVAAIAGISDGEIDYRIRQLTPQRHARAKPGLVGVVVLATIATLFAQGMAWSEGRSALTRGPLALAAYDACHVPHALQ